VLSEALRRAEEEGFDLVEVAPNADPPVCRIIDYGKYKYQKQKRDHEARKKQTFIQIKEVKVRPKIKDHDLETKVRHIRRFLESGNKAKVSVIFRWREMNNTDQGKEVLDRVKEMTADIGHAESEPKLETRSMIMILAPLHKKEKAKEKKAEEPEQAV
jgi:translation initiation factor IF-3